MKIDVLIYIPFNHIKTQKYENPCRSKYQIDHKQNWNLKNEI